MDKQGELITPTFQGIVKQWDKLGDVYKSFDSCPQSFYYSLVNLLHLEKAKNILEVGCGRCALIPYSINIKNPEAAYFACDICPKMIEIGHEYLQHNLSKYQSKLTYEQWLSHNKLSLQVANGEQPFNHPHKFDRIICNMVLMLTENAENMLQNLYSQSKPGCLLGVSVWGDRQKNNYHEVMGQSVRELGFKPPAARSNFYLNHQVGMIGEKVGWEVVSNWEQIVSMPFLDIEDCKHYAKFATSRMAYIEQENDREAVRKLFLSKIQSIFDNKKAIIFSADLYILRRKQ